MNACERMRVACVDWERLAQRACAGERAIGESVYGSPGRPIGYVNNAPRVRVIWADGTQEIAPLDLVDRSVISGFVYPPRPPIWTRTRSDIPDPGDVSMKVRQRLARRQTFGFPPRYSGPMERGTVFEERHNYARNATVGAPSVLMRYTAFFVEDGSEWLEPPTRPGNRLVVHRGR